MFRPRTSRRAAYTLLEVMMVVAIIGVVAGMSMGGIDRLDPGASGLQKSMEAFVQSSRDRARATGQAVVLRIEMNAESMPERVVRLVYRPLVEANFEPMFADREQVQTAPPAVLGKPGRVGAGLDLGQGGGASITGRSGLFNSPEGVQFEFDLRPDELLDTLVFQWEDLGEVELRSNGALRWRAVYGNGQSWADQDLETAPGLIRPHEWSHVRVIAARTGMEIYVNGRSAGTKEVLGQLPSVETVPFLGDPRGRYRGKIDEFVAWGRTVEFGPQISGDQDLLFGALEVQFDQHGRLDSTRHDKPVEVRISSLGQEVGAFQIGVFTEEYIP